MTTTTTKTTTSKTTKTTGKSGKTAKLLLGLAAAATIATTMMPTDAEAGWHHRHRGGAIAAGIFGGLAVGALVAGAAHASPGYYAAPAYAPDCYWVKQRRVTWDGFVVVRNVRVCD